jgi:Tol biopolymer transport system component
MSTGRLPFRGNTTAAVFDSILNKTPLPPLRLNPDLPAELERIINKALEKERDVRHQSAAELCADLKRLRRDTSSSNVTSASPSSGATASASRWLWIAGTAAALILLGLTATWFYSANTSRLAEGNPDVVPFTSSPGQKSSPVFSPEGNQLAFSWKGEKDDNEDIYVKLVGAGNPLRLTTSPQPEYCPAWSPDGRYIAFIRDAPSGGSAYYVIPSLGGAERRIADWSSQKRFLGRCMDWSSDGRHLIAVETASQQDKHSNVVLLSVEDGQKKTIVSPPDSYVASPTLSGDGRMVAYIAGTGYLAVDAYVVPASGGQPRRLTSDRRLIAGIAWTSDGKEIVFSSNRGGLWRLWRISVLGGTPQLLGGVGVGDSYEPIASAKGDRLAYVHQRSDPNIWRIPGPAWKGHRPAPSKLIASSREDISAYFSPDGNRIVFVSDRSGSYQIWTCNSDGSNPLQLTSLTGADLGSPRWSPNGNAVVFDARLEGHGDIFVISADGGAPRRVTAEPFEDNVPTWSRDGNWIYFSSDRTGNWQIWKVPATGGGAIQVTKNGGFSAEESLDGKSLYIWREEGTLWRMPTEGGDAVSVLQGVPDFGWWAIAATGIYHLDVSTTPAHLKFFDFATLRSQDVTSIELGYQVPGPQSLDISPDGQSILFMRVDEVQSDIMLVENFH